MDLPEFLPDDTEEHAGKFAIIIFIILLKINDFFCDFI